MKLSATLIQSKIYEIRGARVMLDYDLAEILEVQLRALTRKIKSSIERFPPGFMFRLSKEERDNLRLQFEILPKVSLNHLPYAFTKQGTAMLSAIINSDISPEVIINITRAFVRNRECFNPHDPLSKEIEALWKTIGNLSEAIGDEPDSIYPPAKPARKQKNAAKGRAPVLRQKGSPGRKKKGEG